MATIDIDKLAQLVKSKRGSKNLREIALEIKNEVGEVSISTLSRIEQGKLPDLSTYMKICEWLNVSPEEFTLNLEKKEKTHKEEIFFHLRADQSLSPEVSETLTKMIEIAYNNFESLKKNIEK